MNEFVDQTKSLVGTLGWDLFREMRGQAPETAILQTGDLPQAATVESPQFLFLGDGFAAKMEIGKSGDFVVKGGSKARIRTTKTIPRGAAALRQTLLDTGVLNQEEECLFFTSDYSFSSASAAAAIVIGTSANGRSLWKLPMDALMQNGKRAKNR